MIREFFDVDTRGDAVWCFMLATLAFLLWPLVLLVAIAAMAVPWGHLGRGRTVEVAVKLALVTAAWCGCAMLGAHVMRGWWW